MAFLIDTNIFIANERGRIDLSKETAARRNEECFVSVVTVSELLHGVHRAISPEIRAVREARVEAVIEGFRMLEIDLACARAHSKLWAELASSGSVIGPHDMWLAATCLVHELSMVTLNKREFDRVPGLAVETWASS